MAFKVYRDYTRPVWCPRKVVVALVDAKGNVLDKTYVSGILLGLGLRIKMRKARMLKLNAKLVQASAKV